MPTHWTYDSDCPPPDEDLRQGDILVPTEKLRSLFKEVHPHFCDEKYLVFMIITQSCDLVRRNGTCSARYINVAVVRSLSAVLLKLIDTVCSDHFKLTDGFYSDKGKQRASELLKRIFNQNEQKLGLFYLFPDAEIGIAEDAVAYLRVSVSFRADNYDVMCNARQGRLNSEFANKLGWLVGNLYSRVGTRDWPPDKLKEKISPYLTEEEEDEDRPMWIHENHVHALRRKVKDPSELSREALIELAREKPKSCRETGIDNVMEHIRRTFPSARDNELKVLRAELINDTDLANTFRR